MSQTNELRQTSFELDRTYRVTLEKFEASSGTSRGWAAISPGYGPMLQSQFPAIEQATRLWLWSNPVITYGDKRFVEQGFAFAEASVFEIFTIPFVSGDPATALIEPNTVVLSESVVRKYFGNANPLGKTFTYKEYGATENFTVTGVIKDVPRNSHFRFDFLASFANLEKIYGKKNMDFMAGSFNFPTYILLSKGARISELVEQFPDFLDHNIADIDGRKPHDVFKIHLQSLPGIYLHSDLNVEYGPTGTSIRFMCSPS